ncbi:MAG: ThuA domain-containing protein [Armatimonadetes bacterium]|nr:ThuA domain-containing protein [Armatimonadota bacterium]
MILPFLALANLSLAPKHIVLLAGDEEYRSEEGLPQLAQILSKRQGFKCTVCYSVNDKGEIDPTVTTNQPGMEALDKADLVIMLLRFREWPDSQMKHFVDYYRAGKPIIALRTSTHAFRYSPDSKSAYRDFSWDCKTWPGGFGKQVLGETWLTHWGQHGVQATHGIISGLHPILRGIKELFGTTDVYEAAPPPDSTILVRGQVLSGMHPTDEPATSSKPTVKGVQQPLNNPMMPIAWTRQLGKQRILTTTMGAATDLLDEGVRRLLVNGAYWALGLEKKITGKESVELVGRYGPSAFGFGGYRKGVKA